MKIALLSCTSMKKSYDCKASIMYSESPRFRLAYQYAKKCTDKIYILSAKYGLLDENTIISPYNESLYEKTRTERLQWSELVIENLSKVCSLTNDEFLLLSGDKYLEFIEPKLGFTIRPLKGVTQGLWITKLNELIHNYSSDSNNCAEYYEIHKNFNSLHRYNSREIDSIPFNNGIYIMFEKSEEVDELERIVRIGTHRRDNRLKERLKDHYKRKNKDGSIFRKNIGLALLHRELDPFEKVWELDFSKPEIKEQFDSEIFAKKSLIEDRVSNYLEQNITFSCIEVLEENDRLILEGKLIATLSQSPMRQSSNNWLGNYSPKSVIRDTALWNSQGVSGSLLSISELNHINDMNLLRKKANIQIDMNQLFKQQTKFNGGIDTNTSVSSIKDFIKGKILETTDSSRNNCTIKAGDIHKELNLHNRMPSVCSAMMQLMKENDEVIYSPPKGKGSRLEILYKWNME